MSFTHPSSRRRAVVLAWLGALATASCHDAATRSDAAVASGAPSPNVSSDASATPASEAGPAAPVADAGDATFACGPVRCAAGEWCSQVYGAWDPAHTTRSRCAAVPDDCLDAGDACVCLLKKHDLQFDCSSGHPKRRLALPMRR